MTKRARSKHAYGRFVVVAQAAPQAGSGGNDQTTTHFTPPGLFRSIIHFLHPGLYQLCQVPQPTAQSFLKAVAHLPECLQLLFFAALDRCGIGEAPVYALGLPWEDGAVFRRVVAYGYDDIEGLNEEFAHMFRSVLADVDAALVHHLDREGVHA